MPVSRVSDNSFCGKFFMAHVVLSLVCGRDGDVSYRPPHILPLIRPLMGQEAVVGNLFLLRRGDSLA